MCVTCVIITYHALVFYVFVLIIVGGRVSKIIEFLKMRINKYGKKRKLVAFHSLI